MNKYPENIMRDLRQRKGLEPNDTTCDDEINTLTPNEAFEEVLEWDGLIDYAYTIKQWIKDIYGINLNEVN